jgi:hypothetical protein
MKLVSRDDLESLEFHLGEIHQKEISRLVFKFEAQNKEIEKENIRMRDIVEHQKKQIYECEQVKRDLDAKKLRIFELETDKSRMGFEKDEKVRIIEQEIENLNCRLEENMLDLNNRCEEIQFYKVENMSLNVQKLCSNLCRI